MAPPRSTVPWYASTSAPEMVAPLLTRVITPEIIPVPVGDVMLKALLVALVRPAAEAVSV